jgi:hypothetical protein
MGGSKCARLVKDCSIPLHSARSDFPSGLLDSSTRGRCSPTGFRKRNRVAGIIQVSNTQHLQDSSVAQTAAYTRFLMEAYSLSHALNPEEHDTSAVTISSSNADTSLHSYLPARLESKPRKILLHLAQSTFSLASPSHLRLSSAALFHHSYMAFARPGLLENVKAASGRVLPGMNKRDAVDWLEKWAENGKEVRMIIWHAGVLNALLAEFPQG